MIIFMLLGMFSLFRVFFSVVWFLFLMWWDMLLVLGEFGISIMQWLVSEMNVVRVVFLLLCFFLLIWIMIFWFFFSSLWMLVLLWLILVWKQLWEIFFSGRKLWWLLLYLMKVVFSEGLMWKIWFLQMLDFFCFFDGCLMLMLYNDWLFMMVICSFLVCVVLISICFIVVFFVSGYCVECYGVLFLDMVCCLFV